MQIAYSETEGYVPVTKKAQDSEEYKEYLSLSGSDKNEHYRIKIEAAELLLNNTSNTFVTPVFNGSASLRDAAGALIENVTKAERRGTKVDDAFIEKTFGEVRSLYKLDTSLSGAMEKESMGPLPKASVILLWTLAIVWVFIAAVYITKYFKDKKKDN